FSLSGGLYLSEDGGRTFQTIARDVHGDHQGLWIDPTDSDYIISGSDGGWQLSYDGGRNFEIVNTYAFTQFYHINLDNQKPYNICGGLQDNGHWCGPSRTLLAQGNRKRDWVTVSGGDGFHAVPDLERPWLVYTASQGGNIMITDTRTGDTRSIHPYPNRVGSAGDSLATHKFRFNWNAPIVLDPQDSKTVYFGGNVIFKTTNGGQSWEQISADLTSNDKRKQLNSGGPIVRDNTAAEFHSTLLTIAPSPKNSQVIWAGSDDGNIQLTQDGGKTWTNVVRNIAGLPPNAWVSTIHASDHDAGTAYVAASHWQTNDYAPYAYVTRDYGKTWKRITSNLPLRGWVHVVRDDPRNPNLLYLGTEFGPYVSFNGGERWYSLRLGIAATPVRDLLVHSRDNELVIGTHGRGIFILDDLTPLQRLAQAQQSEAYVFEPKPAARYVIWGNDANLGQKRYQGENPPFGALIYYYSRTGGDTVRATIADAGGKHVRRLTPSVAQVGVNRIVWDLRYDGARPVAGQQQGFGGGGGGFFGGGGGPAVVPGSYTVTLTLGGKQLKTAIAVAGDPRSEIAEADLQQQLETALALRDLSSQVNGLIDRSNDLIRQLTNLTETLKRAGGPNGNGDQTLRAALTEAESALKEVQMLREAKL
ncbi:MAG: WD40/YVTN/BNR-like repeat-containing protein, partial [Gemmatimonadaceae bacterium]